MFKDIFMLRHIERDSRTRGRVQVQIKSIFILATAGGKLFALLLLLLLWYLLGF